MSIDELISKIKNREIDKVYINIKCNNDEVRHPLYIIKQSINNDYFDCHISKNRYLRCYYKDYMTKFWLKEDKRE